MEYEIIPGLILGVNVYKLPETRGEEVARVANSLAVDCGGDLVIVGVDEKPDPCRALVAYIHFVEALERGTRIRNHNLRFLMEYYGESQLKEILRRVERPRWLLVIYKPRCRGFAEKAASLLEAAPVSASCNIEGVFRMVEASVLRGVREGY